MAHYDKYVIFMYNIMIKAYFASDFYVTPKMSI